MSTSGTILRTTGRLTAVGVYHHSDSHPTELGRFLWKSFHGFFKRDLTAMMDFFVTSHPAGWSMTVGTDLSVPPQYLDSKVASEDYETWAKTPRCYCHNGRNDPPDLIQLDWFTDRNELLECGPWAYLFDENRNTLAVIDVDNKINLDARDAYSLFGTEPPWEDLECGKDLERCRHYARVHFPELEGTQSASLPTDVWLGRAPFKFNDATHFLYRGKLYKATGGGTHTSYLTGKRAKYPLDCWLSSVVSNDTGLKMDLLTARVTGHGYIPYTGVTWVYPPTKTNPTETLFSLKNIAKRSA